MSLLEDPLALSFEAATIEPAGFGHRKLTRALGAEQKFHATITWAWVVLLHDAMQDCEGSFDDLLMRHPSLLDKQLLSDLYD